MINSIYLALSGLAAVVLHESAHVICASLLGIKVKRIGINWHGPYIVRDPGMPLQNFAISLSGPMANLVSTGLVFFAAWFGWWIVSFAFMSLILGVYNLLPLPHSDGQRAMSLLKSSLR